jgi:hypothetical protein
MKTTRHEAGARFSTRKAAAWLLTCILATVIGGALEVKAEESGSENRVVVAKLSEEAFKKSYSYTLKSFSMTPEKSPEEFWKRLREESKKKGFDSESFIEKVTRGLTVKVRSEHGMKSGNSKNSNPNYHLIIEESFIMLKWKLVFDRKKFCIPTAWLKKLCDGRSERCRSQYRDGIEIGIEFRAPESGGGYFLFVSEEGDAGCVESIEFVMSGKF